MTLSGLLRGKKRLLELEKFLQLRLDGLFITSGFFLSWKPVSTCIFNPSLAARNLFEALSFWRQPTTYLELSL